MGHQLLRETWVLYFQEGQESMGVSCLAGETLELEKMMRRARFAKIYRLTFSILNP